MDIRLSGYYKSLTEFEWLDVPMFAVVTGPNGSGKTQLLELIAKSVGVAVWPEGQERGLAISEELNYENRAELTPRLSPENVVFRRSYWPVAAGAATLQSVIERADWAWNEKNRPADERGWNRLWYMLEKRLGKTCNNIAEEEFRLGLPPNFPLLSDKSTLRNEIPDLFVSYLHSMQVLLLQGRRMEEVQRELTPLPWDTLNDVLASAGLSYRVIAPRLEVFLPYKQNTSAYTLAFEDIDTGNHLDSSALSSGEKVMFQVALWFFSFSQEPADNASGGSERLLLLDEPDAHLHPALTKNFLHVIHSELVEKHGIRVIMTTHSPSTVALAPEASIFVMRRQTPRITQAESKWQAVGQLTAGFLTIGSESKCVFVEDEADRKFYLTLQELLTKPSAGPPALDPSRSIHFIAASKGHPGQGKGDPSGGKNNVEKWVKAIQSTQIAGIIDRDAGNTGGERVYVLGRYDLEAYLLDPLFVYAVLLENKKAPAVPGVKLGVHDARPLLRRDSAVLQAVVDTMLAKMRSLLPNPPVTTDRLRVRYHNGPELHLDRWFLESSAKQLLEPLRKHFELPLVHEDLTKQYHLMEIVPTELVEILKKIQAA